MGNKLQKPQQIEDDEQKKDAQKRLHSLVKKQNTISSFYFSFPESKRFQKERNLQMTYITAFLEYSIDIADPLVSYIVCFRFGDGFNIPLDCVTLASIEAFFRGDKPNTSLIVVRTELSDFGVNGKVILKEFIRAKNRTVRMVHEKWIENPVVFNIAMRYNALLKKKNESLKMPEIFQSPELLRFERECGLNIDEETTTTPETTTSYTQAMLPTQQEGG